MKYLFLLVLLLLPATARAQLNYHDCLQEYRADNRVSGKIVYRSWLHPYNGIPIQGYVIILLRPRCFAYAPLVDPGATADFKEVELMAYAHTRSYKMQSRFFKSDDIDERWAELDRYLRPRIGQYVVVTGQLERNFTAYHVANPQIVVRSIAPCEITPRSTGIEKC